jgi:hypothetical protein
MTEEIERRLRREPGARERGFVPPTLPTSLPATGRAGLVPAWRTARALAGVVAAVVLAVVTVTVAGGALRDLGHGGGGIGSGVSPSPEPTLITLPSPTPLASGAAPCGPYDFAVSAAAWDAAAGSRGTTMILRLVDSAAPCTLSGSPAAGIDAADGTSLVRADARDGAAMTLQRGAMVSIGLAWANWCGMEPQQPLSAWIVLPGSDMSRAGERIPVVAASGQEIPVPPCNGQSQPASLSITDFAAYAGPVPEG